MDLTQLSRVIREKELLERFSQEGIMEFYFGQPIKMGKKYRSIFREDKFPSGSFFYNKRGYLMFHDFATGDKFNFYDVAKQVRGKSMNASNIYDDMTCNAPSYEHKDYSHLTKYKDNTEYVHTPITCTYRPMEDFDLKFFGQFNISKEILDRYNVKKVDRAWINHSLKYLYVDKDPCYCYTEGDKFKLYRPLQSKRNKFRNNYNSDVVEGISIIPEKGNVLVITKALKDVMTFYSLGVNAVALRSESTPIDYETMINLKERFKRVIIWLDTDETGLKFSKEQANTYQIERIVHQQELGKDPSDIVKFNGIEKLKELCTLYEIL
jgi:hypothetical protein